MAVITRNFYIALAVVVCILFVGGYLFRHSEIGSFAVLVATFAVGFTLLHVLDDRDERRRQQHGR
jgi:hypothetical protein